MRRKSRSFRQLRQILGILALAGIFVPSMAQEKWEKEGEGEIKDVEIEIIKDRKIILPLASRNFEKVPPRPYEPIKPAITYELKAFKFSSPEFKPMVRPLKLKQEELSKINGNYLSVGVGNYASFFVEGDISTKRDKDKFLGAHFNSRYFGEGPVNDNSGSSATQARVFGKLAGKDLTLNGEASFENRGGYFYGGYIPETSKDKTRQSYNIFGAKVGFENTKPSDFNYGLTGGYSYLSDHYNASEGITSLTFRSDYALDKDSRILVTADYYLISRKDSLVTTGARHLFRVRPSFQFVPIEKMVLTLGVNIALQNDQYQDSKDLHIYPHARVDYDLGSTWKAYGLITGDMDKVDLHSLSSENIWVAPNISVLHTNRAFELGLGLNGKVGKRVAVATGVSVAKLRNYYYYIYLSSLNKFDIAYDASTDRINPFAEVTFMQAEKLKLRIRGDYFTYSLDQLDAAFNRPTYKVQANLYYNLYEKISFEVGLIAQGGMKGQTFNPLPAINTGAPTITLDPASDLYFKTRYFVSRQFSAFVNCSNMLSTKYPLYQDYQSRGLQILGGVSWSF